MEGDNFEYILRPPFNRVSKLDNGRYFQGTVYTKHGVIEVYADSGKHAVIEFLYFHEGIVYVGQTFGVQKLTSQGLAYRATKWVKLLLEEIMSEKTGNRTKGDKHEN